MLKWSFVSRHGSVDKSGNVTEASAAAQRDLPILEVTGNHKKVSQEIAVISASLQPTPEL